MTSVSPCFHEWEPLSREKFPSRGWDLFFGKRFHLMEKHERGICFSRADAKTEPLKGPFLVLVIE